MRYTFKVKIIGLDLLYVFIKKHPKAKSGLTKWKKIMEANNFEHFNQLKRQGYNSVDYIGDNQYCFDIGGNSFRLIATINFKESILVVDKILTHAQYERK